MTEKEIDKFNISQKIAKDLDEVRSNQVKLKVKHSTIRKIESLNQKLIDRIDKNVEKFYKM